MSEAGPGRQMPEFAVTLRGYDRGQVEEYVSALQAFLAEAQRRAAAAEAALAEVPHGGSPAAQTDETGRPDQTNRADESAFWGDAAARVDPSDPLLEGLPERVGASVARILAEAQQAARALLDEAQVGPARQVAASAQRLRRLTDEADREQARRDTLRRQLAELRDALAATTRQT